MSDKDAGLKRSVPYWLKFLFGGMSGMLSTCVVQPADLLKTRMQLSGPAGKDMTTVAVLKAIIRKEGFLGLYSGLSAALFRQATYTTARLGFFNATVEWYTKLYGVPGYGGKVLIGMMSGGIAACTGTPADVALVRMTADGLLPPDQRRNYRHVFDALSRMVREEGVGTLTRGVSATISRAMVVNGVQLSSYAQAREALLPRFGEGVPLHFFSSMLSGTLTTIASAPIDIIKTRVQNSVRSPSQISVLKNVIRQEGILALWSGMLPIYIRTAPHTVLTFLFLEQLNTLYLNFTS